MSKDTRYQTDDLSKLPDDLNSVPQPQPQPQAKPAKTVVVQPPAPPAQAMPKPMPQSDYVCLKDRMQELLAEVEQLREKIEVQEGVLNAIKDLETSTLDGQEKINKALTDLLTKLVDAYATRAQAETNAAEARRAAAEVAAQAAQQPQHQSEEEPEGAWAKFKAWWTHRRQLKARKRRQREAQEDAEWEIEQRKRLLKLRELADGPASAEGVEASIEADRVEEEINRKKKSAAA